jgi:hypothetical protein
MANKNRATISIVSLFEAFVIPVITTSDIFLKMPKNPLASFFPDPESDEPELGFDELTVIGNLPC